jgi:hypothetical protein
MCDEIGAMGGVIGEGLAHINVFGGRQADGVGDMRLIALTTSTHCSGCEDRDP